MVGASLLCKVPLFADISSAGRQALSGVLQERHYRKNESVFYQGNEGSSLFIISSGSIKIAVTSTEGKEKTLALLSSGDFFGELSLIDGEPRSADATATEASHVYVLSRQQFLDFLKSRPEASLKILAALSCRLRRADELIQDVLFLDVPSRLLKAILELAESRGIPKGDGIIVDSHLSQSDLATLIGATRESVNKWMGHYQRRGLLRFNRSEITIPDPNKLRRMVQINTCEAL